MKTLTTITLATLLAFATDGLLAAVAFRGVLTSGKQKNGAPAAVVGSHKLSIRLYTEESADKNDAVWGRKIDAYLSNQGEFYITLDDAEGKALYNEPKHLNDAIHAGAEGSHSLYVGITVDEDMGGSEITPRSLFVTTPYAQFANDAVASLGNFNISGDLMVSNDLQVLGSVTVGKVFTATNEPVRSVFGGRGTIPIGGVIMWSGAVDSLPSGWVLCDGKNNTPDLRGKFLVGRDNKTFARIGDQGGEDAHALTIDETPPHHHSYDLMNWKEANWTGWTVNDQINNCLAGGHNEDGQIDADNSSEVLAHENRPSYYTIAYIMRVE